MAEHMRQTAPVSVCSGIEVAAQRGADKAAATRRRRTRPVTLARSTADEVPVPAALFLPAAAE